MGTPRNSSKVLLAVLLQAVIAVAAEPAARTVPTHQVLELFAQRERARSEQLWLRSYLQPPLVLPFAARHPQRLEWQDPWSRPPRSEPLHDGRQMPCSAPQHPAPPYRRCPELNGWRFRVVAIRGAAAAQRPDRRGAGKAHGQPGLELAVRDPPTSAWPCRPGRRTAESWPRSISCRQPRPGPARASPDPGGSGRTLPSAMISARPGRNPRPTATTDGATGGAG
jgi:hypothetical protein